VEIDMISVPEEPSADNHQPSSEKTPPNPWNREPIPARSVYVSPKPRRAFKVQDGHSSGEQCLYAALWAAGKSEGRESRLITAGFDRMSYLASIDKKNVRIAAGRLVDKLALDLVSWENSKTRTGRTYRVWSWSKVIERRIAAGMEWYIKTRGVEFVRPPDGFPEAQARWDAHLARAAYQRPQYQPPVARKSISLRDRFLVFKRDRYRCCICGRAGVELQLDHKIPVARGGSDSVDNLQTLCCDCNRGKGNNLE